MQRSELVTKKKEEVDPTSSRKEKVTLTFRNVCTRTWGAAARVRSSCPQNRLRAPGRT